MELIDALRDAILDVDDLHVVALAIPQLYCDYQWLAQFLDDQVSMALHLVQFEVGYGRHLLGY